MEFGKTIQIIRDLTSSGSDLKKEKDLKDLFPEYQARVQATLSALLEKTESSEVKQKLTSILSLQPRKLTFLNRLMLFKFRADYLSDWSGHGQYCYYIDEVNLILSGILKSMVVDEVE